MTARRARSIVRAMLAIDLRGKRALVAGVADDGGFGFAIAKALAEAGATVCVGTWPPALGIFKTMLERGKFDESLPLSDGRKLAFERIYPLDADFDTLADVPAERRANPSATATTATSPSTGLRARLRADFGEPCARHRRARLANGPEVKKPLLETSPQGLPRRRRRLGVLVRLDGAAPRPAGAPGRLLPRAHVHGVRARRARLRRRHVVGQGGARERHAHARVRGRAQVGPSRQRDLGRARARRARQRDRLHRADDRVLQGATRRCPRRSPRARSAPPRRSSCRRSARGITGTTVYVDKGYHAMGIAVDAKI